MLKDGIDAIIDALAEILKIPILIGGQLLQFAAAMGVEVPNQLRPWAALLVALFVVAIPIIIDRCASIASRLILAYGIVCSIFILGLITMSTILNRQFATFQVAGQYVIRAMQGTAKTVTFQPIRYGSNTCDANESHTNRVCSNAVQEFVSATTTISSANCGSGVSSVKVDPDDKTCIIAVSHLQGCGYDRLPFGINNCRGRGWIEFSINGAGSVQQEQEVRQSSISGIMTSQQPLSVDLGQLGPNEKIEYQISVSSGGQERAKLTNVVPSQGDFAASVLPNGSLQVSFGRVQAN